MPRPLRILFAGPMATNESLVYRYWALQRLGQHVFPLDDRPYIYGGGRVSRAVRFRTGMTPLVRAYNTRLLEEAERYRVDVVWTDKAVLLRPETLRVLRRRGIYTVDSTIDDAFGPRRDPIWRMYKRCVGLHDLHILQRDVSLRDYERSGARGVHKMQTAYDLAHHFPPPPGWSDRDRDPARQVSFIGSPYDGRVEFFTRLKREHGISVAISGTQRWAQMLPADLKTQYTGTELFAADYRETIWRARINLSFITHSNRDEYTHKTFEIAGCGGFQIAERSPGHLERFIEDEEIVLFSTLEECAEKIRRYLPDEAARTRVAAAGRRRAVRSGYDNDTLLANVLQRIRKDLE